MLLVKTAHWNGGGRVVNLTKKLNYHSIISFFSSEFLQFQTLNMIQEEATPPSCKGHVSSSDRSFVCVYVYVCLCVWVCVRACVCTDTNAWERKQEQVEWWPAASDRKWLTRHFLSEICRGLDRYVGVRSLVSNQAPEIPARNPPSPVWPTHPRTLLRPRLLMRDFLLSCSPAPITSQTASEGESAAPPPPLCPSGDEESERIGIDCVCFEQMWLSVCFFPEQTHKYVWSVVLNWLRLRTVHL